MKNKIKELKSQINIDLNSCKTEQEIESIRLKYLGKKGAITALLKNISTLTIEEKKIYGSQINQLKASTSNEIENNKKDLEKKSLEAKLIEEKIDITLPGNVLKKGKTHPITQITNEIYEIFSTLGFDVAEGREVETDYYNFEALNFPPDHPARDMHDTFYLEGTDNLLLRTHTSNVQIHLMEKHEPPIKVIIPGKVFRSDADVSHSPVFHQVEGLYIDKNVSMSNLIATLQHFSESIFKKGSKIRIRPSYFPFTEPSVEVDVECVICNGKGCGVCKKTGWLEIMGAGMVDPNVLKSGGVDTEVYSGFAFGMGVERIAMLKYGIDNIKLFFDNHNYFVEQF